MQSLLCFLALLCLALPAQAITLTQKGDAVHLKGIIKPGAFVVLREFLARPEAKNLRIIYLDSGGGNLEDATQMARYIRKAGLVTAFDGTRKCMSACTLLFAAGKQCHYFNHAKVRDELLDDYKGRAGLGYHQAHNKGISGKERNYSGRGSQLATNVYYEHGSAKAADFMTKAGHNQMYLVSGPTALANGLATSLSPP